LSRDLRVVADPGALAAAAADEFAATVAAAVAARGRAGVALAGGSTPLATYRRLAARPDVPWSQVHVFFGDERCVAPTHPDSNYGRAREALLDHVPVPPSQVHRLAGELEPRAAAAAYERTLGGWGSGLDLILLGMGADGHVASLFPGTAALAERRGTVCANWVPRLDAYRLTLTLPAINAAGRIAVLVAGDEKAPAVAAAWRSGAGDVPAGLVDPAGGVALWLVDRPAAALLGSPPFRPR
jgi:6-phosphogluconolactonase